jgi:hypothetical protein
LAGCANASDAKSVTENRLAAITASFGSLFIFALLIGR